MFDRRAIKVMATATLIVGSVDALYATVSAFIRHGTAVGLWQFVASGLFGKRAYEMGMSGVLYGIVFHYLFMAAFSVGIYLLCRQVAFVRRSPAVSGICYGLFMWVVMNCLVLPLSNTGAGPVQLKPYTVLNLGFGMHLILGLLFAYITRNGMAAADRSP